MSRKYHRPKYIKTSGPFIVEMPFVQTSGRPGTPYVWINAADAAVHSLLAAMRSTDKGSAELWIKIAQSQIADAVNAIGKPYARVLPGKPEALP